MMQTITVVNIKCGGCANTIKKELTSIGAKNVSVNIEKQQVTFDGDMDKVMLKLNQIGYPDVGSKEAKSFLKKAKSFVSCGIGKIDK